MSIMVQCPDCKRPARVFEAQRDFICSDDEGCAFMCPVNALHGSLEFVQGDWYLKNTFEEA